MHPLFFSSRGLILAIVIWLMVTLLCSGMVIWPAPTGNGPSEFLPEALMLLLPWYGIFLFICLSNFYLCLRLPLETRLIARTCITQVISGIAALGIWLLLGQGWAKLLDGLGSSTATSFFAHSLPLNIMLGATLYVVWILWHYIYLQARNRETDTSEDLQKQLLISEVELLAIKAAMHPHFLYNSLNMLANISLVAPDKIHNLCVHMSDFLRYSLNYSNRVQVTIADELNHINNYLRVEHERFGHRLQFRQFVDPATDNIPVFPLLLFPLVENAIKHGIGSRLEPGFIELSIRRHGGQLAINVKNSCDTSGRRRQGTGHGLTALQKRLTQFYHQRALLKTQLSGQVFEVTLLLPLSGAAAVTTGQ